MPVQTTKTANVYLPDGALVSVKGVGEGSYTDVGAINSAVTLTLEWTENQVETANAGKLPKQIKSMQMSGGFTLINLEPSSVARLSGGILTEVVTTGTPVTTAPDETIASGAAVDKTPYALSPATAAGVDIRATALTVTSVSGSVNSTLTENEDYTIIPDSNSPSGFSIVFNTAGSTLTTMAQVFTVDYDSVTPIESTKLTGGHSTFVMNAVAMKITHTDDNAKIREVELYSVDMNTGGFQFNFLGANEDGVENMPLTFTAKLDTSRTSGDQLFAWTVEDGAM